MICPKCNSSNVDVQIVSETTIKPAGRGCLWWAVIGWWWIPLKWIFLTLPALIWKIIAPKRYKSKTVHISMGVCQDCGNNWRS